MYTSFIGKRFLKQYNEQEGTNLSAKEFFTHIQFPVFFNSDKHLMHVHGSTFFQKVGKNDLLIGENEPIIRLQRLHRDIAFGKKSGSTYVGYAAEKITEVSSGQVTSLECKIDEQEIYASWIGEGLSLGVTGGLLLINEPEILWFIFKGWKIYRMYLDQTPNLKVNQIETWNGQWLYHIATHLNSDFQPPISGDPEETGLLFIPTISWIKEIFALARLIPNKIIIGNAYVLSKTNSTYGFVKIYLPDVRKLFDLRDKLFIDKTQSILSDFEIENLSTFYNFKSACKLGTIGLRAMEPARLREYMPKGSVLYAQGTEYKFSDKESYINYQLFKIWIIAMVNKTELLTLANNVAGALLDFEKSDERGKKVFSTLSQEVRESENLTAFIDKLTRILNHLPSHADVFKEVVEQILNMPTDNFALFVTLIRFEYAFKKSKNNN